MANAKPSAVKRGWELYRASTPPPSLSELNATLEAMGEETIRPRTYKHYRRMEANGFEEYLPINEVDMRLKLSRAG
jgi:hypothetical protein